MLLCVLMIFTGCNRASPANQEATSESNLQTSLPYADLKHTHANVAIEFAEAIGRRRDVDAIPYLIAALDDFRRHTGGSYSIDGAPTVSFASWGALHDIGSPAAAKIGPMLGQLPKDEIPNALWVLSNCAEETLPFIPKISELTTHDDLAVRYNAATCLMNLESQDISVHSALVELLGSKHLNIRVVGCMGLSKHSSNLTLSRPKLLELLSDDDATLRGIASYALGTLRDSTALPHLKTLGSDDGTVFNAHLKGKPQTTSVKELALEAIATIEQSNGG